MPDAGSETSSTTTNNTHRKKILTVLTALFLFIGLIFLVYWLFIGRYYETTDDAYVAGNIVQVMSQVSGQVTQILADETDLVQKGKPIIMLDKADAEIALKTAETNLAVIVRQVSQYYQNVAQLQAKLKQQEDQLHKAKDDYDRRAKLVVGKVIAIEDLEHSKIALQSAQSAVDLARHQLNAAIALVANSDLYHNPTIVQAEVKLRDAYLAYKRTTIYAPETGYIAKRPVQVGQQITPDSVLMIVVPLGQVWVDANFKESQLSNFRIGQPAELISDIYGSSVKYRGKVAGLNPGAGNTFSLLPPQNATGNWIKIVQRLPVRVVVDPEQLKQYPLRLGLSMTVTVDTHDRSGATLAPHSSQSVIYRTEDFNAEELNEVDRITDEILRQNADNATNPAASK